MPFISLILPVSHALSTSEYVRVSDEDRGALFQQPGQSGGDPRATGNVKGGHPSLGLVGIEEEGGSRSRGKEEFGEGGCVACLGGGVKGGDESVVCCGGEGGRVEGREEREGRVRCKR